MLDAAVRVAYLDRVRCSICVQQRFPRGLCGCAPAGVRVFLLQPHHLLLHARQVQAVIQESAPLLEAAPVVL